MITSTARIWKLRIRNSEFGIVTRFGRNRPHDKSRETDHHEVTMSTKVTKGTSCTSCASWIFVLREKPLARIRSSPARLEITPAHAKFQMIRHSRCQIPQSSFEITH